MLNAFIYLTLYFSVGYTRVSFSNIVWTPAKVLVSSLFAIHMKAAIVSNSVSPIHCSLTIRNIPLQVYRQSLISMEDQEIVIEFTEDEGVGSIAV